MLKRAFRSSRTDLAQHRAAVDVDWDGVTERKPCPICGGDSQCRTHAVDAFVCCARRQSEWPLTNGGWLHRVALRDGEVARSEVTALGRTS